MSTFARPQAGVSKPFFGLMPSDPNDNFILNTIYFPFRYFATTSGGVFGAFSAWLCWQVTSGSAELIAFYNIWINGLKPSIVPHRNSELLGRAVAWSSSSICCLLIGANIVQFGNETDTFGVETWTSFIRSYISIFWLAVLYWGILSGKTRLTQPTTFTTASVYAVHMFAVLFVRAKRPVKERKASGEKVPDEIHAKY